MPENIATMKALMAPRKENRCIHCHDVKVAELKQAQQAGRFSRDLVFTYPAPSATGIELDPDIQNRVYTVSAGTAAQRAGIVPGDTILSVDGQRVLTFADFARVLELTPSESALPVRIRRADQSIETMLNLSGAWRRTKDPSWRESLHVAGPNAGFWGHKLSEDQRKEFGLPSGHMAVRVTFIWGEHARNAGIKKEDIVVKFDGFDHEMTIPQLHAHLNLNRNYGDAIPLTVRRGVTDMDLTLSLPKFPEP